MRVWSTLSDTCEQERVVPQGSLSSPTRSSLKINNIVKSVLNGLEASLFGNDFVLSIRTQPLLHAQRLMQLCVNRVQDWASDNGSKCSTSRAV